MKYVKDVSHLSLKQLTAMKQKHPELEIEVNNGRAEVMLLEITYTDAERERRMQQWSEVRTQQHQLINNIDEISDKIRNINNNLDSLIKDLKHKKNKKAINDLRRLK